MYSTKSTHGSTVRRPSGPVPAIVRQVSVPPSPASSSSSSATKITAPSAQASPAENRAVTNNENVVKSASDFYKFPLVMTPVSQLSRNPRRSSRPEVLPTQKPADLNPQHYNPDGTLHTVHKLPGFQQSYSQAMRARYIRHPELLEREKELSVNEIFGRSENQ